MNKKCGPSTAVCEVHDILNIVIILGKWLNGKRLRQVYKRIPAGD